MRKNFVLACLTVCLVMAAITAGWIVLVRASRPSFQASWVKGLYMRKALAAATAHSRGGDRIVLIGGSGVHYGFSAEEVSRITGRNVVNFGVHAGLGLDYLLYRARKVLKPGDLAVLVIEPHLYWGMKPTSVLSEVVLRYDLSYLRHAKLSNILPIIYGFSPADLLQEEARRLPAWRLQIVTPDMVDGYGDDARVLSALQTPLNREQLEASPLMPLWVAIRSAPPEPLIKFLKWAHARNIKVGFAWTPMLRRPEYSTPTYKPLFDGVTQWYLDNGGFPIGHAEEYFQPIDNMFDFWMHANEKGRMAAAKVLGKNLCQLFQCPAP